MEKQKILFLKSDFEDYSIENNALTSTPYELVVISDESKLLSYVENPSTVAIITSTTPITSEIIQHASPSCRVVTVLGVGYDPINVKACREHNIVVCHVPDYGTNEVADHAIALLFAAHRRLSLFHRAIVEKHIWKFDTAGTDLHSLCTLNLGVIGIGRIGSCFAAKMNPFVRKVFTYDIVKPCNCNSMDEILEQCDIISLHVPLTSANRHLISSNAFSLMKKKPILINTSRGAVVDTKALIQALKDQQISYAALDVLEDEPNIDSELTKLDRIQLTPHAAWFTQESSANLRIKAIQEVLRVLNGESPLNPVPDEP